MTQPTGSTIMNTSCSRLFKSDCIMHGQVNNISWEIFKYYLLEDTRTEISSSILNQHLNGKIYVRGELKVSSESKTTTCSILLKREEDIRKEMQDVSDMTKIYFIIIKSPSGDDKYLSFEAFKKYISDF